MCGTEEQGRALHLRVCPRQRSKSSETHRPAGLTSIYGQSGTVSRKNHTDRRKRRLNINDTKRPIAEPRPPRQKGWRSEKKRGKKDS